MKEEGLDTPKVNSKVTKAKNPRSTESAQKANQPLPWWVEILFVQIGLPDKWLRSFLKFKKDGKRTLNEKKNYVGYTFLLAVPLIYLSPIVVESNNNNSCVNEAIEYLRTNRGEKYSNKAWAMRFCNGGDIK